MKSLGQPFCSARRFCFVVELVYRAVALAIFFGGWSAFAQAPQITVQPTNRISLPGANMVFNFAATGQLPLSYVWRKDGVPLTDGNGISGSSTANLFINSLQQSNAGTYSVIVTNSAGTATSANGVLTVTDPLGKIDAAYIASYNSNTVSVVARTTLAAIATIGVGSQPLKVVASSDGEKVFVGNYNSGNVSVIDTATRSVAATITVGSQPVGLAISPDSLRLFVINTGSSNLSVVDLTSNTVLTNFSIPRTLASITYHPTRAELWIGMDGELQVRSATNLSLIASQSGGPSYASSGLAFVPNGSQVFTAESCGCCGKFHRISGTTSGGSISIIESPILNDGLGAAYAVAVNPVNGQAYLGKSGHCSGTPRAYEYGSARSLLLASPPQDMAVDAVQNRLWVTTIGGTVAVADTVGLTNIGLVSIGTTTRGIAFAPFDASALIGTTLITQPQSQNVAVGSNVTLSVSASGGTPFGYYWFFNSLPLVVATNTSLTISNAQPANAGNYFVVVSNSFGSITSQVAVLEVHFAPALTVQPLGRTLYAGQNLILGAGLSGNPLNYQWLFNGAALPGQTNALLFIPLTTTNDSGGYSVVATNYLGAVTSAVASVVINPLPAIRTAVGWGYNAFGQTVVTPSATNVIAISAGSTHVLALRADGTVVAWGRNLNGQINVPAGLSNVVAVSALGAQSIALKNDGTVVGWGWQGGGPFVVPTGLSNVVSIIAGADHCLFLKSDGSIFSDGLPGALNNFGQHFPPSGLVGVLAMASGGNHNLAIKSDGTLVRWGINFPIPAGLSNIVTIAVGLAHSMVLKSDGSLAVWGANDFGQTNVPSNLGAVTAISGGVYASAVLKADGTVAVWGENVNGQTNIPTGLSGVTAVSAGDSFVTALMSGPPAIRTQPQNLAVTNGANGSFTVDAVGPGPLNYQWRLNGATLPAATNTSLALTNIQFVNVGNYSVIVSNSLGSITSIVASLTIPTVQVAQLGNGVVAINPQQTSYTSNQQITLTATPARYFTFLRWSDGNTNSPRNITVGASNNVYTAIFTNTLPLEELVFTLWDRSFGGTNDDGAEGFLNTGDGSYLVAGNSSSGISGNRTAPWIGGYDGWVIRLDSSGNELWQRSFGGSGADAFRIGLPASDGGFILAGSTTTGAVGVDDAWVAKIDAQGDQVWEKRFGGLGTENVVPIVPAPDGGVLVVASSASGISGNKTVASFGNADGWLIRLDANGNDIWQRALGGSGTDNFYAACRHPAGGWVVGAESSSGADGNRMSPNRGGPSDFWIIRINDLGQTIWEQSYGGDGIDGIRNMVMLPDGGIAVAGTSTSTASTGNKTAANRGGNDGWFLRLDGVGNILWQQTYGGSGDDDIRSVAAMPDGGFLCVSYSTSGVSGNKTSPLLGQTDVWMFRLDANGTKFWERNYGGNGLDYPFAPVAIENDVENLQFTFGGWSDSAIGINKLSTNYGGSDAWIVKSAMRQAPVGTPVVLVNSNYSPVNAFAIPATNLPYQVSLQTTYADGYLFYTLDGSGPVPFEPNTFTYAEPGSPGTPFNVSTSVVVTAISFDTNGENQRDADLVTVSVVPVYNLTNTTPGGGSVAMNPAGGIYWSNTVVTLTATPSNGWSFMRWEGASTSTNSQINLTMDSSKTIRAVFGTSITNTINPNSGAGYVALWPTNGPYPYGSVVRLVGVPSPTNRFFRWFNNLSGPTNSPYDFIVLTANTNITAYFPALTGNNFTLATPLNGYGTVTRSPNANSYASNTVVTLTAVPDAGYVFTGWGGNASGLANPINVTVNSNKVVTAGFVIAGAESNQPPTIAITNPSPGAIFTAPVNISINTTNQDSDGTVTQVVFRVGASLIGTVSAAPFNFTWTNAPVGTNTLTAVATDNGGLSTTSAPVSVVVETALPQIVLTAPTNNAGFFTPANVSITAIASDADNTISNVTFYAGTNLLTTFTAQPYTYVWSNVTVGSHTLSARVQDIYGPIVTSAPVNITVSAPPGTNPPVFRFNPASYTVNASNGSVSLTVSNAGDLGGLVNYTTLDGTAYGGSGYSGDFTTQLGSLTFSNGQHSANITVGIRNNFLNAPDVTFQVQLFQPSTGTLGSPSVATVTIQRNDPSGATNSLTTIAVGSGQPATGGALQVTLTPPEAGGQWRFPWDIGWRTNGAIAGSLEAENYPIEFCNVSNYVAYPATLTVAVTNGGTTPATGEYHPGLESGGAGVGSLTVNISPNAPGGSGWRLLGEASYRAPNSIASNLLADTYFVEFASVGGWAKPATRAVQVAPGQGSTIYDNYLLPQSLPPGAGTPGQLLHSQIVNPASFPYWFNGQLQTDVGFGSGVVVRETVVLTAAHLVFNDVTLSYVNRAWWSYQKEAGVFDPKPIAARGWYVLSGYAAQRTNDIPNAPVGAGVSSAASRNLDVAALYFTTPAARGGFGGYLASDTVPNPWLTDGTKNKMLVGYPVDGSSFGQTVQPGKMYATALQSTALNHATNNNYTTASFISYPGNSGGPVYVSFNGYFYPAAVYLGTLGSGVNSVSVVRAINSDVVNLINLASSLGDAGTNNTGGGVTTLIAPGATAANPAYVRVLLGPPAALQAGGGWRLSGDVTYGTSSNYTRTVTSTNATIEFKPLVGWNPPSISSSAVQAGALTTIPGANYTQIVPVAPTLMFAPDTGFGITGTTNTKYRIEYRTNLTSGDWLPLQTNIIISGGFNLLLPWPPTNGLPAAFYRAVWLP